MYLMINRNNRPDNSWSKVFCAFKNIENVYSASDLRGSTNIHHVNDQVVHIAPDFEAPWALPRHTPAPSDAKPKRSEADIFHLIKVV